MRRAVESQFFDPHKFIEVAHDPQALRCHPEWTSSAASHDDAQCQVPVHPDPAPASLDPQPMLGDRVAAMADQADVDMMEVGVAAADAAGNADAVAGAIDRDNPAWAAPAGHGWSKRCQQAGDGRHIATRRNS